MKSSSCTSVSRPTPPCPTTHSPLFLFYLLGVWGYSEEQLLYERLKANYSNKLRPLRDSTLPLNVTLQMILTQVVDVVSTIGNTLHLFLRVLQETVYQFQMAKTLLHYEQQKLSKNSYTDHLFRSTNSTSIPLPNHSPLFITKVVVICSIPLP